MTTDNRTCPSCKTPLPAEAHFCLNCGTPTPTEPGVPERTMPTGAIEVSKVRNALADRYKIEHVLGEGGMATVYQAEDLKHHRKVAVKVMRPELAETLGAERFLREVEIAAKLSHPHILPVYDSGAANGVLYYVMPVIEGESLPARLSREKQLPVEEALRLAREVAEAMAYAHERGFVHRDIKPANILISAGHALVADFGIARAMSNDGKVLTQTGLAIGTPQYMSPEQASGASDIDGRSDIYALGCVLYEMIAGEPPFTGPTAQAVISRSITEDPRPLTTTRQALAPSIDSTVMRALAKAPADRYATANAFVTALVDAENQSRSGFTAAGGGSRGFKPWQMAVGAVAVLAIGVIGTRLASGGSGDAELGNRVAVLPFVNQGSTDDAYFADGIVDEVRGKLARVGDLKVIASASANQYRDSEKSASEIAGELRVDHVLMGRVRWGSGTGTSRQVQVVAELVNGKTGETSWQQTFDADMADAFSMQTQIATRVASALGAALQPADEDELADHPTDNPVAYDLYLKGMAIDNSSAGTMRVAAGYFSQAVALDSTFAEAWSALGRSLSAVYTNGTREPELGRQSKEAVDRALELAPDEAFSHRAAAAYYANVERNAEASRRETNRALALDPNNAEVLSSSALDDYAAEDYESAFEKLTRARELDPRSTRVLTNLVYALTFLGRADEAIEFSDELMDLAPTGLTELQAIVAAHLGADDMAGAKAVVRDALTRVPPTELVAYFAGYQEMAFVLDQKERDLLFRLTPAAFDNDVAWWGQALSIAAYQQGDMVRAKAYADSSLEVSKQQVDANPTDPQLRALYAVMLAYSGNIDEAIREADRAVADAPRANNNDSPYARVQRVRVLLAAGRNADAIAATRELMGFQYYFSPDYLQVDPMFNPVRNDPAFQRLLAGTMAAPVD